MQRHTTQTRTGKGKQAPVTPAGRGLRQESPEAPGVTEWPQGEGTERSE